MTNLQNLTYQLYYPRQPVTCTPEQYDLRQHRQNIHVPPKAL